MKYQYRIHPKIDRPFMTLRAKEQRVYDSLYYFRERFPKLRIERVEERFGSGEWIDSALLPTSAAEAWATTSVTVVAKLMDFRSEDFADDNA